MEKELIELLNDENKEYISKQSKAFNISNKLYMNICIKNYADIKGKSSIKENDIEINDYVAKESEANNISKETCLNICINDYRNYVKDINKNLEHQENEKEESLDDIIGDAKMESEEKDTSELNSHTKDDMELER